MAALYNYLSKVFFLFIKQWY